MANAARKVQERIFGTSSSSTDPANPATPSLNRSDPPTPLTINIPKPSPNKTPTQPPPRKPTNSSSPKPENPSPAKHIDGLGISQNDDTSYYVQPAPGTPPPQASYRERLAQKLGNEYKGAEKHRLQQDDNREKHWKRWGPYLSDRQWVLFPLTYPVPNSDLSFFFRPP